MPDLEKRTLGRTGMEVTTLGYGAMELRGAPRGRAVSSEQADKILNAVLDAGINYIDTSIDYGTSEESIGRAIAGRRSQYFLASKCGCVVEGLPGWSSASGAGPREAGGPNQHVFTRENIVAGVNQSLARMKTDYLDLVQFHGSPSKAELEKNDAIQTVLDLKKEGKVRFIGMSSTLPNLKDHVEMGVFDAFQIPYSAVQREHEEIISAAAKAGAGVVIRGGVAKGGPGKEEGPYWEAWQKARVDDLLGDMSRMEFIFRFTISHPDLDTTIVGTINPEHLQDNINAMLKGPLPADLYEEAKRRLPREDLVPAAPPRAR
jgi:aryl-alcohol dehydrogenase-like predicted oxidoreductase